MICTLSHWIVAADLWSIGLMANTKTYLAEQADKDAEDYWYYKYCEEEWCIFATFDKLSAEMHQYMKKLHDTTDDTEHFEQRPGYHYCYL